MTVPAMELLTRDKQFGQAAGLSRAWSLEVRGVGKLTPQGTKRDRPPLALAYSIRACMPGRYRRRTADHLDLSQALRNGLSGMAAARWVSANTQWVVSM
jgi:hypothetical protein